MMINTGSLTASYMVALDDDSHEIDECENDVAVVNETIDYQTVDEITPSESLIIIGLFLGAVFFFIFILPIIDVFLTE